MSDLVKSVIGGRWSLVVGWILPVFLSLQLITVLALPGMRHFSAVSKFLHQSLAARQLSILATAAVAGLVLAAAQAPLYRILEGYSLWPAKIAEARTRRHRARRRKLVEKHAAAAKTDRGVYAGLIYERAARYPAGDKQFAPTALGNAIRRFETYAGDRYQLDSQLLWHDLTAVAPQPAVDAVDQARTSVDFFVCLLYGSTAAALFGIGVVAAGEGSLRSALAVALGFSISAICYRLAVIATDEWDAAVRAVVDLGRVGVASAFGLTVPPNLTDERLMWRAINTLVRRQFSYSESKGVPAILELHRAGLKEGAPVAEQPSTVTASAHIAAKSGKAKDAATAPAQSAAPRPATDRVVRDGHPETPAVRADVTNESDHAGDAAATHK